MTSEKLNKMEGVPVSEPEVAAGLGFKDVTEFRRWQTDLGRENAELKYALKQAHDEARHFRWGGMRMAAILDRVQAFLKEIKGDMECGDTRQLKESLGWYDKGEPEYINKLLLAIDVVNGRGVDWDHTLDEWLEYLNPARVEIKDDLCTVSGIFDGSDATKEACKNLAAFTGPKLTVDARNVGLVSGGIEAWLAAVPKDCHIYYKDCQLAQCVYYSSDDPLTNADYEGIENWDEVPKPAAFSCLVKPPDYTPEEPEEEVKLFP